MTDRRVKVTVDADYQPLIDGSGKAAVSVKVVKEEVSALDKEIEETGRDMEKLAAETALAKKEVDGLGSKARGSKRDLEALDEKIKASRKSVQELGLEFARTGEKVDSTAFNREKSLLSRLERLRQELTAGGDSNGNGRGLLADAAGIAASAAKVGEQAGTSFMSGLSDTIGGKGKAILIGALVEAAVIAAVPVGAALSGAVTAAFGAVGIAGGIFAASKDPVVRSAATQFGQDISRMFFSSGAEFIEPIRKSLALLDKDFADINLGRALAPLAGDTEQLANGIGRFAKNIMPGLEKAFQKAGPFINALSDGLAETGRSLSQFIDDISRNHGAVEGLRLLFAGLDMTVRVLGKTFEALSAANDWVIKRWSALAHMAADVADFLGLPADKMHALADAGDRFTTDTTSGTIPAIKGLGDAFAGSAAQVNDYKQAVMDADKAQDDFIGKALDVDRANIAVEQGWKDLSDAIKENGKHWDDHTESARKNRLAVDDQIDSLRRARDAAVNSSTATVESIRAADEAYNAGIQKLLTFAKQAGATATELAAMAKTYSITIDVTEIRRQITQNIIANKVDKELALHGFASGGTTPANEVFKVGEHGPEYLFSDRQAFVATQQQMAQPWAGGAAGGQIIVQNNIMLIDPMTGQKTRAVLRNEATSRGQSSDVVSAAYP